MNTGDKTAVVLICIIIVLAAGASVVYNLPLWLSVQKMTTPLEEAPVIAQQTYEFFLERSRDSTPDIQGFNPKENSHMADVKELIALFELILVCSVLGALALILQSKQKAQIFFGGSAATMVFLICLMLIPFDALFIQFHEVFFAPGTWTFSNGLMIQAFPQLFFVWLAQLWWIRAFVAAALICVVSFGCLKFRRSKN